MREHERIDRITTKLFRLWRQPEFQDLRLGQLLVWLDARYAKRGRDLFHVEDDAWEAALDDALAEPS